MVFSQLGVAIPNFWIGILFILVFSTALGWFPAGGFPGWSAGLWPALKALLLPAVALALPQAAVLTRVTRSATLEVIGADFVRTARAKGLSEGETLRGHVVPNALIPVATILGLQLSFFFGGAILVENVFNLPGLGRLAYQALAQRDLVVIKDVVLIFSGLVILVNFAVDLDTWPSIRACGAGHDRGPAPPPKPCAPSRRSPDDAFRSHCACLVALDAGSADASGSRCA